MLINAANVLDEVYFLFNINNDLLTIVPKSHKKKERKKQVQQNLNRTAKVQIS